MAERDAGREEARGAGRMGKRLVWTFGRKSVRLDGHAIKELEALHILRDTRHA